MEIEKLCFDEPFDESFLLYLLSKKNCFCKIIEVSMENISKDLNNEGTLQKEIMNNELYRSILFPHNNANISVNNNNNMVVTDVIEGTYLAGYVIYELVDKKNCQIVSIAILPEYRGQRLAEELLRYVINVAHKEYISLHCLTSNLSAQKLYSRLGFKTISWDVNYYHSMNADGILMRLHIDPHTGTHTDN